MRWINGWIYRLLHEDALLLFSSRATRTAGTAFQIRCNAAPTWLSGWNAVKVGTCQSVKSGVKRYRKFFFFFFFSLLACFFFFKEWITFLSVLWSYNNAYTVSSYAVLFYLLHIYCCWYYDSGNLKTLFHLVIETLMIIVQVTISPGAKDWTQVCRWSSCTCVDCGRTVRVQVLPVAATQLCSLAARTRNLQKSPIEPRRFPLSSPRHFSEGPAWTLGTFSRMQEVEQIRSWCCCCFVTAA